MGYDFSTEKIQWTFTDFSPDKIAFSDQSLLSSSLAIFLISLPAIFEFEIRILIQARLTNSLHFVIDYMRILDLSNAVFRHKCTQKLFPYTV